MAKSIFFRIGLPIVVVFSMLVFFVACDDDDDFVDTAIPEFSNFPTSISTAPGLEFVFEGTITDDNGLLKVNIAYDKWFLNKDIEFNDAPKLYNLKYKFLVPADEDRDSSHTFQVSVTDLGGNTTTYDVVVTLDYDNIKPNVEFISPTSGLLYAKGESVEINIEGSDNKAIASVVVKCELLEFEEQINFSAGENSFSYLKDLPIPIDTEVEGSVTFDVQVTDTTGNMATASTTVIVGEKNIIPAVYAVGSSLWWEWDPSHPTQLWNDPDDEDWFILEFYYWTGYGIKFIGQLGWEPNNWGTDPNDPTRIINSQDSGTIEFDEGDGYYRIRFNPYTLEYTYEKMVVDIEVRSAMYLMGSGFTDYPLNWNPADAIPMDADWQGNPYVFTAWVQFSDDVSLKFIGQTDGWGPFDCGFEVGGETVLPVNYVKTKAGDGTADLKFKDQAGWYWINFDYFLMRTSIFEYN